MVVYTIEEAIILATLGFTAIGIIALYCKVKAYLEKRRNK